MVMQTFMKIKILRAALQLNAILSSKNCQPFKKMKNYYEWYSVCSNSISSKETQLIPINELWNEIKSKSHNSFKKQHSEMRKQIIKKNNNKV